VLVFYVGYLPVTKCYLIVEELGTQITQKTFKMQVVYVVSGQPKAVSGRDWQ
jgi:hypothetical protein